MEGTLSNQLVALSVSNSPDLGRLGLLKRSLDQTVSALATALVRYGARIVYGGPLNRKGFSYLLYPTIAQAYATAAIRASRPPFVQYVSAYLAQDAAELAAHLKAVSSFAEVRLVDCDRAVTRIVMSDRDLVFRSATDERRLKDMAELQAFVADLPRRSAGLPGDLDAMREAMDDVSARTVIGGAVIGYNGNKPGIFQETLLALEKGHSIGPGYQQSIDAIGTFADRYRLAAQAAGAWYDLICGQQGRGPGRSAEARHPGADARRGRPLAGPARD